MSWDHRIGYHSTGDPHSIQIDTSIVCIKIQKFKKTKKRKLRYILNKGKYKGKIVLIYKRNRKHKKNDHHHFIPRCI